MKRVFSLLCAPVAALMLVGCSITDTVSDYSYTMKYTYSNSKIDIYDSSETMIAQIEEQGLEIFLGDRLVYSRLPKGFGRFNNRWDIYCHDFLSGQDEYLGTIKGVYGFLGHQDVYLDEHVYVTVTLGDLAGETAVYDIDLSGKSVEMIYSTDDGCVYGTLSSVGGKLLISNLGESNSRIVEYDPETKQTKTAVTVSKDDGTGTLSAIRTMCSDGDLVYVLRVVYTADHSKSTLYLDRYDLDYTLLDSIDMKDIFDPEQQAIFDQTDQIVVNFIVSNGYLYYENFSTMVYLGRIKEDNTFEKVYSDYSGVIDSAYDPYTDDDKLLLLEEGYDNGTNKLYLFDSTDGTMKQCDLGMNEPERYLCGVSKSLDGRLLFCKYPENDPKYEDLPENYIYTTLEELEFK